MLQWVKSQSNKCNLTWFSWVCRENSWTMTSVVPLVIFSTFVTSNSICTDQERELLEKVVQKGLGYHFIYAIDETMSSRNALNMVFHYLNFIHANQFEGFYFITLETSRFCPSSTSYERIVGAIPKNNFWSVLRL